MTALCKPLLFFIVVFLFSCGFNRMYYLPYPLDVETKVQYINQESKDTTRLTFTKEYKPVFSNNKGQVKEMSFDVKSFSLNKNNREIYGWIMSPLKTSVKAKLLFLHGNAGNVLYQYQAILPLVLKGYKVYMIDYSGFGFSSGKPNRKNVLEDGEQALAYVFADNENESTTKLPIIVYGQSLGGHLAAVVAAKHPEQYDVLVIEGAFSSHKDIAANGFGFLGRLFVKEEYAAKKYIQQVHKPVLIVHSIEDKTIPFKQGKRLFENANEPKQFYQIKGPHIAGPVLYTDSIDVKIEEMLKR